uniref:Uncharacterized protein n=1 Tax=Anguilla anguilla TaxID=7936 RepID=A0A0E9XKL4_ANGAN
MKGWRIMFFVLLFSSCIAGVGICPQNNNLVLR